MRTTDTKDGRADARSAATAEHPEKGRKSSDGRLVTHTAGANPAPSSPELDETQARLATVTGVETSEALRVAIEKARAEAREHEGRIGVLELAAYLEAVALDMRRWVWSQGR